jgi:hypothetical protein
MTYEELRPVPRVKAESMITSENPDVVCRGIISAALFDDDWRWVQDWCLRLAGDNRAQVKGCAITSLGHLARVHRVIDLDLVIPVLEQLVADPEVGGRAEDALGDIHMFILKPSSDA